MDQHLLSAAQIIQAGGVIAYPTESVYGLGCDPFNQDAVMQLLAIKQRPVSKGLILIGETLAQLAPYLRLNGQQAARLQQEELEHVLAQRLGQVKHSRHGVVYILRHHVTLNSSGRSLNRRRTVHVTRCRAVRKSLF